jgi:hypothetical protein
MSLGAFTTDDDFTLRAFGTMYLDYGLEITLGDGESLFYSPCCLSNESYGRKPHERFEEWEDADAAEMGGDTDAFVPWSEADWVEALKREADDFIEAYVGAVQ